LEKNGPNGKVKRENADESREEGRRALITYHQRLFFPLLSMV
jgi:hypothetical protein